MGFQSTLFVLITLLPPQVRVSCQPLEHLLRYCARPPFALERLSVIRSPDGLIARVRSVLPRHKATNWVGPGRGRKSTRPGANGVVEFTPFEFLDRLADLVPRPRKHRHRYHGVFAPNHKLRPAVTALAIGNVSKQREATTDGHGNDGRATGGCCEANPDQKPRSHDTSLVIGPRDGCILIHVDILLIAGSRRVGVWAAHVESTESVRSDAVGRRHVHPVGRALRALPAKILIFPAKNPGRERVS